MEAADGAGAGAKGAPSASLPLSLPPANGRRSAAAAAKTDVLEM